MSTMKKIAGLAALAVAVGTLGIGTAHADPGEPAHGHSGDHDAYALAQDLWDPYSDEPRLAPIPFT
jgi:hypothetical protein